jgi:putative protease
MSGVQIGQVTHYYNKISVAALALTGTLRVGDTVHVLGRTTDLQQEVTSLQIEHQAVDEAGPEDEVALRVKRRVRPRDKVFKITGQE